MCGLVAPTTGLCNADGNICGKTAAGPSVVPFLINTPGDPGKVSSLKAERSLSNQDLLDPDGTSQDRLKSVRIVHFGECP